MWNGSKTQFEKPIEPFAESEVLISGEEIFVLTGSRLVHDGEKIIADSKVSLEIELYSRFPLPLVCERLSVSLQCKDSTSPAASPGGKKKTIAGGLLQLKRTLSTSSNSSQTHAGVGRTDSTASNASFLSRQGKESHLTQKYASS
jgi:hypothetical protein